VAYHGNRGGWRPEASGALLPKARQHSAGGAAGVLDGRMGELEKGKESEEEGIPGGSLEARRRQAAVVTDGGGVVVALVGFGERAWLRGAVS